MGHLAVEPTGVRQIVLPTYHEGKILVCTINLGTEQGPLELDSRSSDISADGNVLIVGNRGIFREVIDPDWVSPRLDNDIRSYVRDSSNTPASYDGKQVNQSTSIGTLDIVGPGLSADSTVKVGDVKTYNITNNGDATGLSYVWTIFGGTHVYGGPQATSCTVTWTTSGPGRIVCEVTSSDAEVTDSPKTIEESLNVEPAPPPPAQKICLGETDGSIDVTVENAGNGNKYVFNGYNSDDYIFKLTQGTYTFNNIPVGHPIAFHTKDISTPGGNPAMAYSGTNIAGSKKGEDDNTYNYYYGTVTLSVTDVFLDTSFECFYHGYMGGKNIFNYDVCNIYNIKFCRRS